MLSSHRLTGFPKFCMHLSVSSDCNVASISQTFRFNLRYNIGDSNLVSIEYNHYLHANPLYAVVPSMENCLNQAVENVPNFIAGLVLCHGIRYRYVAKLAHFPGHSYTRTNLVAPE
jgi:hypothetical protein